MGACGSIHGHSECESPKSTFSTPSLEPSTIQSMDDPLENDHVLEVSTLANDTRGAPMVHSLTRPVSESGSAPADGAQWISRLSQMVEAGKASGAIESATAQELLAEIGKGSKVVQQVKLTRRRKDKMTMLKSTIRGDRATQAFLEGVLVAQDANDEEDNPGKPGSFTEKVSQNKKSSMLLRQPSILDETNSARLNTMLGTVNFDAISLDESDLIPLAIQMFRKLNLIEKFGVDVDKFGLCLAELGVAYKDNPYHNFRHAIDTAQAVYYMIVSCEFNARISPLDIFAALLAALAHDTAHPGRTNPFLVATSHPLAVLYNDASPLENLHAARFFEIMQKPQFMFLPKNAKLPKIRAKVIGNILHTDMTKHFKMLEHLEAFTIDTYDAETVSATPTKKTDTKKREQLSNALVHAADISNVCRSLDISLKWSTLVIEEFYEQAPVLLLSMLNRFSSDVVHNT